MNIHRSDIVPDWEKIDPAEWNEYQIRAVETNGWDTPGNRETIRGFGEAALGLYLISKERTLVGTTLVGIGRMRDLRDGRRADQTGTKGPKGEALDAGLDTALMLMAIPILKRADILSTSEAAILVGLHTTKSVFSLKAKVDRNEPHPSWTGKIGAFKQWTGIGLRGLAKAARNSRIEAVSSQADKLQNIGTVSLYGGFLLGLHSLRGYYQNTRPPAWSLAYAIEE